MNGVTQMQLKLYTERKPLSHLTKWLYSVLDFLRDQAEEFKDVRRGVQTDVLGPKNIPSKSLCQAFIVVW